MSINKKNIEKTAYYHIKIFSKNKLTIFLINDIINQRLQIWNKTDKHNILQITKKLNVQKLQKQKLTLFKSPHVHKKAKKSYKKTLYKINITIKIKEIYNNLSLYLLKTYILKNIPKAEKIIYKRITKNKNYINIIKKNILKQNLKNAYKNEINYLKELKTYNIENLKTFLLLNNIQKTKFIIKNYEKHIKFLEKQKRNYKLIYKLNLQLLKL